MPGLLQDSLDEGRLGTGGLESAADTQARKYIQDLSMRENVQHDIGSLVGTAGGIAAGAAMQGSKPPAGTTSGASTSTDSSLGGPAPTQAHGSSMLMGTLFRKLAGGFLHNQVPAVQRTPFATQENQ